VFQRIGGEAMQPAPNVQPLSRATAAPVAAPQLLGFAEPVTELPPVEDFLTREDERPLPVAEDTGAGTREPPAPAPEPVSRPPLRELFPPRPLWPSRFHHRLRSYPRRLPPRRFRPSRLHHRLR